MRRCDYIFLAVVTLIIIFISALLVLDIQEAYSGRNQQTVDVTDSYLLPEGMDNCRVFRMTPAGFGQSLYVISRDGDPVAVGWPGHKGRRTFVVDDQ